MLKLFLLFVVMSIKLHGKCSVEVKTDRVVVDNDDSPFFGLLGQNHVVLTTYGFLTEGERSWVKATVAAYCKYEDLVELSKKHLIQSDILQKQVDGYKDLVKRMENNVRQEDWDKLQDEKKKIGKDKKEIVLNDGYPKEIRCKTEIELKDVDRKPEVSKEESGHGWVVDLLVGLMGAIGGALITWATAAWPVIKKKTLDYLRSKLARAPIDGAMATAC